MQEQSLKDKKGGNAMTTALDNIEEEISCLAEILNEGLITKAEFEIVKKSLIGDEAESVTSV